MARMQATAVINAEDRTRGVFERIAQRLGLIGKAARNASFATSRMTAISRAADQSERSSRRTMAVAGGMAGGRFGGVPGVAVGGLAISGAAMKAATSALSLERSMFDVRKATDETGAGLKAYETKVLDLARTSGKTKEEIAGILAGAAFAGRPKQELMQFTDYAIAATGAWGTSAADTGQALAELGNIYQANQKRIEEIGDAINTVADSSASKETDLLDFLRRTGGTGKMLGISAENMLAIGASLKEVGVQSEVAATGVNALLMKISVPDDKFDEALKKGGLDAKKFRKEVEKDATGAILTLLKALDKLEGTKKLAVLKDLFGLEYADDIGRLTGSVGRLNELLTVAADKKRVLGSVRGQAQILSEQDFNRLERANQSIDVLFARLGGGFKIAAGDGAEWVNRLVDDFERAGTAGDKLLSVVRNIDQALANVVPKSNGKSLPDTIKTIGSISAGKYESPEDGEAWHAVKGEIAALEKQIADIEGRVHPSRRGEFNPETDALLKRKKALDLRLLNFGNNAMPPLPDIPKELLGMERYWDPRRPADAEDRRRAQDIERREKRKPVKAPLPPSRPADINSGRVTVPALGFDESVAERVIDKALSRHGVQPSGKPVVAPIPSSRPADLPNLETTLKPDQVIAKVIDPVKATVEGPVTAELIGQIGAALTIKVEGPGTVTGMSVNSSTSLIRPSVGTSMGHLVNK